MFELKKTTPLGRSGVIHTAHGDIETPFFMPVATAGAMRGLDFDDVRDLGAQIVLCNTYHLHLHPGEDVVAAAGGLHPFIGWDKPILTDSGGFQVFSLQKIRDITEEGVHFRSHINGDLHFLGPVEATTIQHKLGADMIMCFDECPPSTADRREIERAVDRTLRWAKVCKETHEQLKKTNQTAPLLFGIVQGGLHRDLREKCLQELIAIGFDGYALGGLAVGESETDMFSVLDGIVSQMPEDKPRYLMGVGVIEQLKTCITKGIDMFDCVLPMRIARHGTLLLSDGSKIMIENSEYKNDHTPIDLASPSAFSRTHLKSYLHHLFRMKERLAETIATKQNLGVTLREIRQLREIIEKNLESRI